MSRGSGGGYAAGYCGHLWSEMLEADAFAAFEAGDAFDPEVAGRLRELVHAAGNLGEPAEAYLASRGRLPSPDPLPRQRGSVLRPARRAAPSPRRRPVRVHPSGTGA